MIGSDSVKRCKPMSPRTFNDLNTMGSELELATDS